MESATTGYSGTPLPRKLGIKAVARAAIDDTWSGLPLVIRRELR